MNMSHGINVRRDYSMNMIRTPHQQNLKKVKRFRSAFTTDQVNYLEEQFKKFPYIGNVQRREVALALNISERAVKIWFQNRRMKEKKETYKEFDDDEYNRKPVEHNKDQLINVTMSSANDQRPLSLLLVTDATKPSSDNNIFTNNSVCNMSRGQLLSDTGRRDFTIEKNTDKNLVSTNKVVHPPPVFMKKSPSPACYQTSAEFSIDLCKKYKIESLSKHDQNLSSFIKKEEVEIKSDVDSFTPPVTAMREQILPEDLSSTKNPGLSRNNPQSESMRTEVNESGYLSLVPTVSPFYASPYVTANGVIWKPVSVMPVVPSATPPVPMLNNSPVTMPTVSSSMINKNCNCDCHKPQVPLNFQQQSSNPQYLFTTVPFQNTSTKF